MTSYAIIGHLHGFLWVKACGGLKGGYSPDTLRLLALLARLHDAREIYVEEVGLSGMFVPLFEPVLRRHYLKPGEDENFPEGWAAFVEAEPHWAKGQKEIRIIDALEPVMNQHRLAVSHEAAANPELQRQITRITRQRGCLGRDDEIEALAACVWKWQDELRLDPDRAAERHKEHDFEEALREHRRGCGLPTKEPRWFRHQQQET